MDTGQPSVEIILLICYDECQNGGTIMWLICKRQRTAHAAKPRTKWMKNGILGLRSKAGGRFAIKSASLERGQATFEHTELRFDRVH